MQQHHVYHRWAVAAGFAVLVSACPAPAAGIPAFPGAEGFGSLTCGGRGGRVIEVTTLADSGPGSLREACTADGPRMIVFRTGGLLALASDIKISNPYLTIAGQTAPGGGICLRNSTLRVCTHDVVIRFLRARTGDGEPGTDPGNRDSLKIEGTRPRNVVIDHCSISWSIDENLCTWGTPRDVTIQWCLISEALARSRHPKGVHSMGLLCGDRTRRVAVHHCLLASNGWRNPYFQGCGEEIAEYECRNNVIYNYGQYGTVVRGRVRLNLVGNCFKRGPATTCEFPLHLGVMTKNGAYPRVFASGNTWASGTAKSDDNWTMVKDLDARGRSELWSAAAFAFDAPAVVTTAATTAYEQVLDGVGAWYPARDAVDRRVVADVRNGTGALINSPNDVGGWPEYPSGTAPLDGDHDGMPDAWERDRGLNPAAAADGAADRDGDGYTNLEEYLNGLVVGPGGITPPR